MRLSDLMPYVLAYVPGCPAPLAEQHLRSVCVDFCSKSNLVQYTTDPMALVDGTATYPLDPPTGTVAATVLEAWMDGARVDSRLVRLGLRNTVTLHPAPAGVKELVLLIATKPSNTTSSVADVLMDYANAIGQGAASRLLMMPNQEYTNPQLAMAYKREYEDARGAARVVSEDLAGRGTVVVPRRFQ